MVLKHRMSFNEQCLPVARAFFFHDQNVRSIGGGAEVSGRGRGGRERVGVGVDGGVALAVDCLPPHACARSHALPHACAPPSRHTHTPHAHTRHRCGWATSRACAPASQGWRSMWTWLPRWVGGWRGGAGGWMERVGGRVGGEGGWARGWGWGGGRLARFSCVTPPHKHLSMQAVLESVNLCDFM